MAYKIWVQCPKKDVYTIRHLLERRGVFDKNSRIKNSDVDGYMLLPTNKNWETENIEPAAGDALLTNFFMGIPFDGLSEVSCISLLEEASTVAPGVNPIIQAVTSWLHALPPRLLGLAEASIPDLLSQCPKRWSTYRPLLLLPTGSFQSAAWESLLKNDSERSRNELWRSILEDVGKTDGNQKLECLAINSGIPLNLEESKGQDTENVLRSPSGLIMLYGDFGPDFSDKEPEQSDFERALWVSVKQNGIYQTWAPRYTMFSRGNIKEKERILSFHTATPDKFPSRATEKTPLAKAAAVDLYAGIGYFTFSYAAMGIGKILCWELNPWSVEALRRGAIENKYGNVRVIKGDDLKKPLGEILHEEDRIIVFEEGNESAAPRIEELRSWKSSHDKQKSKLGEIIHVNCGFLPSSEASWRTAWTILSRTKDGWLHLHENVGVDDVDTRRNTIEREIGEWVQEDPQIFSATVEHVELVKTFAPGVWHCVFDVHVTPSVVESD